ncbi:hypothetical protein Pint_22241 [Pistacia integerrima]|uniref:Uncharacterized protein n=1 Tax=Pistacia integerrima TaxID=434235 RepID=A0ACC0YJ38_9ROSI|nr:hypothetical protein Pint_22241 [Pistacia integerrima]
MQDKFNHCRDLVQAFVDYYDLESHCFRVGNGLKVYITLLDVLYIMGLPAVGRLVVVKEVNSINEYRRCFGDIDGLYTDNKGLKLNVLRRLAENEKINLVQKAVTLLIIGSFIMPDHIGGAHYC